MQQRIEFSVGTGGGSRRGGYTGGARSGFEVLAPEKNIQFFDGVIAALPHKDWDLPLGDSKPLRFQRKNTETRNCSLVWSLAPVETMPETFLHADRK